MILQRKVCLLGAYAVGKTSLIRRYVHRMFDDRYLTTVGVRVDKKVVTACGIDTSLLIWDLAGEDSVIRVDLSRCRGASGLIFVADGCRAHTLETALRLSREAESMVGPVLRVILLNKIDLADTWEIPADTPQQLEAEGWQVFLTSARTGENVEEAFLALAEAMMPKER